MAADPYKSLIGGRRKVFTLHATLLDDRIIAALAALTPRDTDHSSDYSYRHACPVVAPRADGIAIYLNKDTVRLDT